MPFYDQLTVITYQLTCIVVIHGKVTSLSQQQRKLDIWPYLYFLTNSTRNIMPMGPLKLVSTNGRLTWTCTPSPISRTPKVFLADIPNRTKDRRLLSLLTLRTHVSWFTMSKAKPTCFVFTPLFDCPVLQKLIVVPIFIPGG